MREKVITGKWLSKKLTLDDTLKFYEYLIRIYCVIENKYLPVSETSLLAFYTQRGGVSREIDREYMEKFNRGSQIISNLKNSLTKRGFLYKHPDMLAWDLPKFLLSPKDHLTVIIELDARQGNV